MDGIIDLDDMTVDFKSMVGIIDSDDMTVGLQVHGDFGSVPLWYM